MKIVKDGWDATYLGLAILGITAILIAGCSAMPATQGDLEEVANATLEAANDGNPIAQIIQGVGWLAAAVGTVGYTSRRRRGSIEANAKRMADLKAAEAAEAAAEAAKKASA